MGSVGSAVPLKPDPARDLLHQIREHADGADLAIVAVLIQDYLSSPSAYGVALGLAKYLCSTTQGALPDLDRWSGL